MRWTAPGARTAWAFFPNWLGYCLVVDALVLWRTGTSLLTRNWKRYIGLFAISAPVWWLFEVLNWRVQNWHYVGRELAYQLHCLGSVGSLAFRHQVVRHFEDGAQALADHQVVVGDENADLSHARPPGESGR